MLRCVTAGESQGETLVATPSGIPAGVPVDPHRINGSLWHRQQDYGRDWRMTIESDKVDVVSGIRRGNAMGVPTTEPLRSPDWKDRARTLLVTEIREVREAGEAGAYTWPGLVGLAGNITHRYPNCPRSSSTPRSVIPRRA